MSSGGGWVKSLQCKSSRALEDVLNPYPRHLLSSSSCRKNLNDVVSDRRKKTAATTKPSKPNNSNCKPKEKTASSATSTPHQTEPLRRSRSSSDSSENGSGGGHHRSLVELPDGHPSRNVVEIIFHTSWPGGYNCNKPFSGKVEIVFKVHNAARTVARFEDYRRSVRDRAAVLSGGGEEDARCAADGNEMMRFHCLGPTGAGEGCAWVFPSGGKGGGRTAICTFSGSGRAHESAGGGGGRRAMLVCRVVAGRVSKRVGPAMLLGGKVGFDSVSGDGGELVVFDTRAVLPCFLVIYKL